MKVSEVTVDQLIDYCNAYEDEQTKRNLSLILSAAKAFIASETGLNADEVDKYEDITLVLLVLCNEMYDNRSFTCDDVNISPLYDAILNSHRVNLL